MSDENDRAKPLGHTVLCINAKWDVLLIEKAILEAAGYDVLLASGPQEGMNIAGDARVDLVLLDSEMRQMRGTEFARRLWARQPALPIIMISGTGLQIWIP